MANANFSRNLRLIRRPERGTRSLIWFCLAMVFYIAGLHYYLYMNIMGLILLKMA